MSRVELSGNWRLIQQDRGIEIPIQIPGDIYSALFEAGIIKDPYFGKNELDQQWIGQCDWELVTSFEMAKDEAVDTLYFHADSIDTVSEVYINDIKIGSGDNMFIPSRFNAGAAVHSGENEIRVLIQSPERVAIERNEGVLRPYPHQYYPVNSPNRNLVRKVQCHGGWDWGPCLMTGGIYGEVYIDNSAPCRIEHVYSHSKPLENGKDWQVTITCELYAPAEGSVEIEFSLAKHTETEAIRLQKELNTVTHTITVENPELWWPNGYGDQPLYTLKVAVPGASLEKKIGFRVLETISEQDERGISLYFKVNGRPVFAKGANWIPADALPARQTEDVYRRLLEDSAAVYMNMIRVWGGGQYEQECFYDICDELGILVWQDFMFSCSTYPAEKQFLESVHLEAEQQVKRLKDHPSIAIWCGNNECLGALTWYEETRRERDVYLVDYDRLYNGTIGEVVQRLDPDRMWWSSSPCAGPDDYSDCWHDDTKGDMHYWSVWHEGKPFETYRDIIPRFCSEFGFQSFPSIEEAKTFLPPDQLNVSSPMMHHHQRSDQGNAVIMSTLARYFRFPSKLDDFLYLSQVQQAYAISTAVTYWRSRRPVCMGALYWQLNDVWPVASWSSIEYSGRWKVLHYEAARFFTPVLLTGFLRDDGKVEISYANDKAAAVNGILNMRWINFNGTIAEEQELAVTLNADSSGILAEPVIPAGLNKEDVFLSLELLSGDEGAGQVISSSEIFLALPSECELEQADITLVQTGAGTDKKNRRYYEYALSTDVPAFYVNCKAETDGRFSDNGFHLLPGKEKLVRFYPSDEVKGSEVVQVSVRHLRQTY